MYHCESSGHLVSIISVWESLSKHQFRCGDSVLRWVETRRIKGSVIYQPLPDNSALVIPHAVWNIWHLLFCHVEQNIIGSNCVAANWLPYKAVGSMLAAKRCITSTIPCIVYIETRHAVASIYFAGFGSFNQSEKTKIETMTNFPVSPFSNLCYCHICSLASAWRPMWSVEL